MGRYGTLWIKENHVRISESIESDAPLPEMREAMHETGPSNTSVSDGERARI